MSSSTSSLPVCLVKEPVVNMREKADSASKVVSQTYFSEQIKIIQESGRWTYITSSDGYFGWIPQDAYVRNPGHLGVTVKISRLAAHVYGVNDTEYGPLLTLPYGSKLPFVEKTSERWITICLPDGKECYIQSGDVAEEPMFSSKSDLVEFSKKFLGLPYTWGGRSSFGFDCSGFIQMLYGKIGFELARDSKQQILDRSFRTVSQQQLEPGDLIFFGKAEGKISHVGMYLGADQFIHSTVAENMPWIRISKLSDAEWAGTEGSSRPYRAFRQLIPKARG